MEQEDGLHIKQETVGDQKETFRINEECMLQWDDSPADVQIKDENDNSKTCTNVDDQNETFEMKQECISQRDQSSSIVQWNDSTGYCPIKTEPNYSQPCEYVEYKTEVETCDSYEGTLALGHNTPTKFEGKYRGSTAPA